MQPLYSTTTIITWQEYKKFYKTDNAYMRIVFCLLMFYQIFALLSGTLNTLQLVLILISIPLTLGIYFLAPVYLLKREYSATKILHDMKLDYCFYPGFFTVTSSIGTEFYYYDQIEGTIETKANLYLHMRGDMYFIFEKVNCSPDLLKFLLSPSPVEVEQSLVHDIKEKAFPLHTEPNHQTAIMVSSTEAITHLFKFAFFKKSNTATGIPGLLLTIALFTVYLIGSLLTLANALQEKNYVGIIFAAVFFLFWYLANTNKNVIPEPSGTSLQLNISFYDTYVLCTLPTRTTATYYYKNLYKVTEDSNFYRLFLTKDTFIPIAKADCTPELITFMQNIQQQSTSL